MQTKSIRLVRSALVSVVLALVPSSLLPGQALGQTLSQAEAKPTTKVSEPVQKVLDDAIKALGGQKAIAKITSLRTKVEMTGPMGTMITETFWSKPDRILIRQTMPGMGDMIQGYDGEVGWSNNPMMGYALLDEETVDQLKHNATHMRLLQMDKAAMEEFTSLTMGEKTTIGDHECQELVFEQKDGESGSMYFDMKSGLPVGFRMADDDPQTPDAQILIGDWTEIDGVKFHRDMQMSAQGMEMNARYTEIEVNKVDPSVFELPEEIKKMTATRPDEVKGGEKKLEDFGPMQQQMIKSMLEGAKEIQDPEQLQMMISTLKQQAARMPGENREAMEFAAHELEKRLGQLQGGK